MSIKISEEVDKLEKQFNDAISLKNATEIQLKKQGEDFKKNLIKLQKERDDTEDLIDLADNEILKLREELKKMNNAMIPTERKYEEIERAMNAADEDHVKYADDVKVLNAKLESKNKENVALVKDLDNLNKEITHIDAKLEKNNDEIGSTADLIDSAKSQTEKYVEEQEEIEK